METQLAAHVDLHPLMTGEELRATWQARVMLALDNDSVPRKVFESIIAHNWDEAFPYLLAACGCWVTLPHLCTAGKISRGGMIYALAVTEDGYETWQFGTIGSVTRLMRKVADALKLTDLERVAMFEAINKWIVCDFRLDPSMDPADPDAKRLKPRLH